MCRQVKQSAVAPAWFQPVTLPALTRLSEFCRGYFAGLLAMTLPVSIWATEADYVEFDSNFLQSGESLGIDVSRFSYKSSFNAGKLELDVFVNGEKRGTTNALFVNDPNNKAKTYLCLTPELKQVLDLKSAAYGTVAPVAPNCVSAEAAIAQGNFEMDVGNLSVRLTLPQALVEQRPRGYVPPHLWQEGMPALYVNYHLNHFQSHLSEGHRTAQTYLNLRAGLNFAGWSLVHSGAKSWQKTTAYTDFSGKYQPIETYLRRAIPAIGSEVVLGDVGISSDLLDGVSLRGMRLATDERMLPNSQRGYAPLIQGVAKTNANVVVKQNGYVIYQLSVPAGPFVINDLNATGYGGDLQVEIQESNGEKQHIKVPFATLVQLVRPKQWKYQLAYGRYRSQNKVFKDNVLQGTVQYGLMNNLSLNAGVSHTAHYQAYLLGFGLNTPIGAFVADATWANAYFVNNQQRRKGYSIRASYSVKLPTETHITLAAYRYSSREFYRLPDVLVANRSQQIDDRVLFSNLFYRPKSQYQLTLSQDFGKKGGRFYLSGSVQNYWQRQGNDYQWQASYSNSIGKLSYSLSYNNSRDLTGNRNHNVYLGLSMPLGKHQAGISYAQSGNSHNLNANLNGEIGNTDAYYGLSLTQGKGNYRGASASVDYQTSVANLSANASQDNQHNRQFSVNTAGAIVLHPKGITLSQPVGDTFAVVHAKGARGAKINGMENYRLDYFGNGILPYATPYNRNYVSLNPEDLPLNLEFGATAREIIPKANQTMLVEFKTSINPMVLFEVQYAKGIIPMGTEALDENGQLVGYVVQGGQLFASKLDNTTGKITLRWNANADGQCQFNYQVPNLNNNSELRQFTVACEPLKGSEK
ncbi:fimbria/pilus outer membrane usher protein [[Haemophilus] felis]|nr:fimbria/pilus outer membrane usher protein [[Haemophilus] felis]NBI40297.1 fimbria/pilus outer membrane usher protein [[Haemophilus] felis]